MNHVQIDFDRKIYLDRHAGYTATCDFGTVKATADALAGHLGMPALAVGDCEPGSLEAYRKYQHLLRLASSRFKPGEVWYDPRTPLGAKQAIESARITRRQIRLHYGDPRSGMDRLVTQDVTGFVGYAGWQLPHPILQPARHVHLGPRICELEVVKVVDVDAMVATYSHANYRLPVLTTVGTADIDHPERVVLAADGVALFECTNQGQATRWIKFFKGASHVPLKLS